ncbi:MAG: hypothetical protein IJ809_02370 [Clostridia bacterium]|nr:hypothetical protein [Clostridia bacterium]
MKNKTKMCCFTVNYTHACIIVNNFITNELSNVKIVYINEKSESKKLKTIVSKFYTELEDKIFFTEWLDENIINDYEDEKFVFVVKGKEKFIDNVNKFLDLNDFSGYVINCYDIFETSKKISDIVNKHDYYVNTEGIVIKEKI